MLPEAQRILVGQDLLLRPRYSYPAFKALAYSVAIEYQVVEW